jgi:DNA (cytosine-5)-methyltransferase 1
VSLGSPRPTVVFGSVCSGIEGASAAWIPLGWRCAWTAEIEPFPATVIQERWGHKNYGDFTQIGADAEPIELLVGGTPCQDFSVAGLRAGMAGERGNLTLEFLRLAGRLRPRWVVWENVPGVLSSNGGRDFGAFLGGLGELGYGFAYRILDAQFFGVPQRRRRVFVVGHLGDWRRAAAVLFERHSLQGHPAPCRKTGERVAATIAGGSGVGRQDYETETLISHSLRADGFDASEDGTGRGTPLTWAVRTANTQANGHGVAEGVTHTLDGAQGQAIAFSAGQSSKAGSIAAREEQAPTLRGGAIRTGMAVRRLTPRECERLQGFPDDYTLIRYRGKLAADGPRYKALGNSWAVPVVRWIGQRIEAAGRAAGEVKA